MFQIPYKLRQPYYVWSSHLSLIRSIYTQCCVSFQHGLSAVSSFAFSWLAGLRWLNGIQRKILRRERQYDYYFTYDKIGYGRKTQQIDLLRFMKSLCQTSRLFSLAPSLSPSFSSWKYSVSSFVFHLRLFHSFFYFYFGVSSCIEGS